METHVIAAGTGAVLNVTIRDQYGAAVTSYSSSATLAAKLWAGDSQTALATPTAAWTDASQGELTLTLTGTDTTQTPATYQVRVTVASGGVTTERYRAWVRITPSPGSDTAPDVYCTFDDMLDLAGDLADSLLETGDLAGFAEQRAKARQWTDRVVIARARDTIGQQAERHAPVVASDEITISEGVDAGPSWGASIYPNTSVRDAVDEIRDALDADDLITDSDMIEANAAYALSLVYGRQMGTAPNGVSYQDLAAKWRDHANRKLAAWTARFDTTASPDGTADMELEP